MQQARPDAGSYRDYRGRVYLVGNRVFRTVLPVGGDDFDYVRETGFIDRLIADNRLVPEVRVDPGVLRDAGKGARYALEHPRLPFISYPYEWPFALLKSAAIFHLQIQLDALAHNVALSDASAYNVQFRGVQPLFIDSLSFCRYREGDYWVAHKQFCEQFVNPLLLRARLGVAHNTWYRGGVEGIATEDLNKLLRWKHKLSWHVFTNVVLQTRLQNRSASQPDAVVRARERKLPKIAFEQMLRGLRRWISGLEPKSPQKTIWRDYAVDNSYSGEESTAKGRFIAEFCGAVRPKLLWDMGCNTGEYSALALKSGAQQVIGFDFDHGALDRAVERASAEKMNFLPLFLDAVNPSPSQGWSEIERPGLAKRATADAVVALALVHHLAIAKNIPLDMVLAWLVHLGREGVIEFVDKSDAMVQRLLSLRKDHFEDYHQEAFENSLSKHARICRSERISSTGRVLYWFSRNDAGSKT